MFNILLPEIKVPSYKTIISYYQNKNIYEKKVIGNFLIELTEDIQNLIESNNNKELFLSFVNIKKNIDVNDFIIRKLFIENLSQNNLFLKIFKNKENKEFETYLNKTTKKLISKNGNLNKEELIEIFKVIEDIFKKNTFTKNINFDFINEKIKVIPEDEILQEVEDFEKYNFEIFYKKEYLKELINKIQLSDIFLSKENNYKFGDLYINQNQNTELYYKGNYFKTNSKIYKLFFQNIIKNKNSINIKNLLKEINKELAKNKQIDDKKLTDIKNKIINDIFIKKLGIEKEISKKILNYNKENGIFSLN